MSRRAFLVLLLALVPVLAGCAAASDTTWINPDAGALHEHPGSAEQ